MNVPLGPEKEGLDSNNDETDVDFSIQQMRTYMCNCCS